MIEKQLNTIRSRKVISPFGEISKIESIDHRPLDGFTLLRFSHATERTGGLEQYLEDVNRALLNRNSMRIIQLYLPQKIGETECATEKIGRGTLTRIPMKSGIDNTKELSQKKLGELLSYSWLKAFYRDWIVYNPIFKGLLRNRFIKRRFSISDREPLNAKETISELFINYEISLVVIHSAGGLGSLDAITEASKKKIPYLIQNHFSNLKLKSVGFREQMDKAAGIGGVSSLFVPSYLKGKYTNLGDGIDCEFFRKTNVNMDAAMPSAPRVILAARVVPGKGHSDLIYAAHRLIKDQLVLKVVFVGREDVPEFKRELQRLCLRLGISDFVEFLGELRRDELRDLLAVCSVAVLPSRSEGLGRVLIEAQAMELPVIAYNVGGVAEALVDGITGFLVKEGDIRKFSERMAELLRQDDKRITMGMAGRCFVEREFSYFALARRHEDWYLQALGR